MLAQFSAFPCLFAVGEGLDVTDEEGKCARGVNYTFPTCMSGSMPVCRWGMEGGRMGWGAWCYAFSLRGFMPFRSLNTNVNSTSTHKA